MSSLGSPTVARVLAGQLCTGCGLCASVSGGAVRMSAEAPGYARPVQQGRVDEAAERTIDHACPGAVVAAWSADVPVHPYWGPYRQVGVGFAADAAIRFRASSGGVLTALLVHALRAGMIDRAILVAADPDHPTRNTVVVSTSEAEIVAGAGSRYSSSSPLADIERQLEDGGRFAFVGKPCDVSALRRLAEIDPRVGRHAALALSFFCAGVSSYASAGRILKAMGVAEMDVAAFRYRGYGWPGRATAILRDGQTREMSYADSWGGMLSKEVQFRCKICPDAVGGVADIACGDAWYGDDRGYPSFDEADGRSIVFARTEAGDRLVRSAVAAGELVVEPLDIVEIEIMQPSQARRKRLVRSRTAALAATLQAAPEMDGTQVGEAARRASLAEELRSFAGTVRRILVGRR